MTANITLLDPTAPHQVTRSSTRRTLPDLAGTVVGFIDNAKPNFDHLVDDLAALLMDRHGVARVIKRRKRSASVPAPDAMIEELAAQCDVVITGSGD